MSPGHASTHIPDYLFFFVRRGGSHTTVHRPFAKQRQVALWCSRSGNLRIIQDAMTSYFVYRKKRDHRPLSHTFHTKKLVEPLAIVRIRRNIPNWETLVLVEPSW